MRNRRENLEVIIEQAILALLLIVFFLIISLSASAQKNPSTGSQPTQQLRGVVVDQVLGTPIEGATVRLTGSNTTVRTDANGIFRFASVAVGTQQVVVTIVGYKEITLDNIGVNSGKETVLTVRMENNVQQEEAVIIKTGSRKNKPLNEMSAVSARAFTVEETQKYAAAVNDPLRMAVGFPGVFASDDGNNNIVIRGNSPTGLLWRMEGVDIPNPNHFSSTGSSGGGISILSTQLLSNSDFITGAFAAEYGNALSGVFDLKLRRGNNEKNEYTLQAGLLGLNAAAEGPFSKSYGGSYLVNYRYSTLQLLSKIGVPLEGGATNFQDFSYNIYLPTRRMGTFTLFGFGGLSSQNSKADLDSLKWSTRDDRYNGDFVSNTAAAGLTHHLSLGSKSALRTALAWSYNKIGDNYSYVQDDYTAREDYVDNYQTGKMTFSSTLSHKFSVKSTLRAGAIVNLIHFDYYEKGRENDSAPMEEWINSEGHTQTIQAFAQYQFKPLNSFTVNAGLHYLQLLYNNHYAIEPRASLRWQVNKTNSLALGYGGHSQIQALGVYFAQAMEPGGAVSYPNKDLDLTKAHHYVLSYQHSFTKNLSVKTEVYYQQLYDVPVSIYDTSTFSVLNIQSEYITDPLANLGKGRNYGVEVSLERYLANHLYYTFSTSIYEAKYKAKDGVERDTRFNGNYLVNLVAGKEFISANGLRTFGINIKTIYAGGLRNTPIDEERSEQEGKTVFREQEAYTLRNQDYFRSDLRISLSWNRKHMTSTLSLDIQNITNRLNVYGHYYDVDQNKTETRYQTGLIPILNYKVEF